LLFRSYAPSPPLDRFIENFWLYQGYASPHLKERILPGGTSKLVFNLQHDELRIYDAWQSNRFERFQGALLSRPSGVPFVTDSAEEASVLGVNFKLGGAFPVLGPSSSEAGGGHASLDDLWGASTRELQDHLCTADDPLERFRILERSLRRRLGRQRPHHPAVLIALRALGCPQAGSRTREVARHVGLSERQFIRLFAAEIGVRPKLFSRVRRFQHALTFTRRQASVEWSHVSTECGYFDQSHMIRDFIAFSGVSPAEYVARHQSLVQQGVRIKPNHLPLAE
jgi:AraC-like DNA-binding protein